MAQQNTIQQQALKLAESDVGDKYLTIAKLLRYIRTLHGKIGQLLVIKNIFWSYYQAYAELSKALEKSLFEQTKAIRVSGRYYDPQKRSVSLKTAMTAVLFIKFISGTKKKKSKSSFCLQQKQIKLFAQQSQEKTPEQAADKLSQDQLDNPWQTVLSLNSTTEVIQAYDDLSYHPSALRRLVQEQKQLLDEKLSNYSQ